MNENNVFGNILKELRMSKKVTQQEIAEITGVTPTGVSYWESGKAVPNYETLDKLANFLGVTVDYLMGRKVSLDIEDKKAVIFRKADQVPEKDQKILFSIIDNTIDAFIKAKDDEK